MKGGRNALIATMVQPWQAKAKALQVHATYQDWSPKTAFSMYFGCSSAGAP